MLAKFPTATPSDIENGYPYLDQARLDIGAKQRMSRFPWKGQFSPDLIDYLLESFCKKPSTVLDPFCGSGTVLYESIRKGHSAIGVEVNPAAWMLSAVSGYSKFDVSRRRAARREYHSLLPSVLTGGDDLFGSLGRRTQWCDDFVGLLLAVTQLLANGNGQACSERSLGRAVKSVSAVLDEIEQGAGRSRISLADARQLEVETGSVDFVITSPPYINVFNYHQNYRPTAEALAWKPLEAARSEIGANRKHRQNRILTVIQYALDMTQCLNEMGRVLSPTGAAVLTVGRTSNVLGVPFRNSEMIAKLVSGGHLFRIQATASRSFVNRYGEAIYEDILILRKKSTEPLKMERARDVAKETLVDAIRVYGSVQGDMLTQALNALQTVQPSPLFSVSVPPAFKIIAAEVGKL